MYGEQSEHVDAGRGDVDRPVRPVVDGVDPGERSGLVRESGDLRDGRDGADRVRRPGEGDDARPVGEERREVRDVEAAVVVDLGEAHREAACRGPARARGRRSVVVESRADDLVARRQSRPAVRDRAKLSVVMFAPNATSSMPR